MAVIRPAFTKQLPPENCDVQSKIIKEIREKNYYYEYLQYIAKRDAAVVRAEAG